jgi:ABC-type Mn2+/Zn2+ transport system ATPase subunit
MISATFRGPWLPYRGKAPPTGTLPALPIQLSACTVAYPFATSPVFQNLSLMVEAGKLVAVIGPNGSGKSTLLKLIAGLIKPSTGEVRVFGQTRVSGAPLAFLPQRSEIDWHFPISVEDMVATGRYVHVGWLKRLGAWDRQMVEEALNRVGLWALRRRTIDELSGGQQQRMLLARALVQEADLLLLDEPLNAVDQASKDVINQRLLEHVQTGGTALMATHEDGSHLGRYHQVIDLGAIG